MPKVAFSFNILDSVDSTNNYAMEKVLAGLARHGAGYFAHHQTNGKGQRGKTWLTGEGKKHCIKYPYKTKANKAFATISSFHSSCMACC
ncbi:MAG: hypothetical protein WDM71_02060 [Ferruginibacter sp.]